MAGVVALVVRSRGSSPGGVRSVDSDVEVGSGWVLSPFVLMWRLLL